MVAGEPEMAEEASNVSSHPDHWFYKDPQGTLQGPFTAQEMAEWYGAGYFTMTLLVKKGSDSHFQVTSLTCEKYIPPNHVLN